MYWKMFYLYLIFDFEDEYSINFFSENGDEGNVKKKWEKNLKEKKKEKTVSFEIDS